MASMVLGWRPITVRGRLIRSWPWLMEVGRAWLMNAMRVLTSAMSWRFLVLCWLACLNPPWEGAARFPLSLSPLSLKSPSLASQALDWVGLALGPTRVPLLRAAALPRLCLRHRLARRNFVGRTAPLRPRRRRHFQLFILGLCWRRRMLPPPRAGVREAPFQRPALRILGRGQGARGAPPLRIHRRRRPLMPFLLGLRCRRRLLLPLFQAVGRAVLLRRHLALLVLGRSRGSGPRMLLSLRFPRRLLAPLLSHHRLRLR